MYIEEKASLDRRAALHAALADLSRLAVVDVLSLGDASPSELHVMVGLPSNLLAHHLKVLERAGVIERSSSEGDKRRTYVRLRPGVLETLGPSTTRTAPRVAFVCTHNSARSQLAAALWRRSSRVPATSAGTRPADRIHPGAVATARRHGLPLARVRPRDVRQVLGPADLVVAVCDGAYEQLRDREVLHWSVADPVRVGTDDAFDHAFEVLADRVAGLAPLVSLPEGSMS